ncbi:hypothetical protein E1A91_A04G047400v1 [Gossypium mustelinum]|uniref:Prolyl 4-hydroxylase 7 n=1 Tax=Gossypium mustelinum TaxID=34275 RepID=A0A5D2ZKS9_GOSMU|nr:hypothetical protein E1A91_A04G047400v1 [Gossypium mustelinum]
MEYQYFLGFFLLLLINFTLVSAEINGSVLKMRGGTSSVQFDPTSVTQLSWRPRAFIYNGFLSSEECDHLIFLAKDKLDKSMVADDVSGQSIESEVRTSSGMFLEKALRITIPEILQDEWFKKGYKPPKFEQDEDVNLDDNVLYFTWL